ncbi:MAG: phage holin family protein [Candidatus Aquicultor sp.]|nr:phage holin family protein [Candidatus Aquicultor sp.]
MEEKARGSRSLVESILDLFEVSSTYVRQQVKQVVDESIAGPIGTAAKKAAFIMLAFTLFSIAAIFISVGLFLLFATLVGYILAYLSIGIVLVIFGAILVWQAMDKKAPKLPKRK